MYTIAVLPGDGIGPEVMKEAIKVLRVIGDLDSLVFSFQYADVGGCAIDKHGEALPRETEDLCYKADAVLFGSVGGPKWDKLPPNQQPERAALLALRRKLSLYANLRPVIIYPQLARLSPLRLDIAQKSCDILIIRELSSGIYFGMPKKRSKKEAIDTMYYSAEQIRRIAHLAFQAATTRNKSLCSVDKANVLETMVLWREIIEEVSSDYPHVTYTHLYVDNAAMQLIKDPSQFDVLLCGNLFGDILSDEAAMISGSMGLLPSASLSTKSSPTGSFGLYEPAGGSAPDIAEKGIANPMAQILSAALMLRHSFKKNKLAIIIERAVQETLKIKLPADLCTQKECAATTVEIGNTVVEKIREIFPHSFPK